VDVGNVVGNGENRRVASRELFEKLRKKFGGVGRSHMIRRQGPAPVSAYHHFRSALSFHSFRNMHIYAQSLFAFKSLHYRKCKLTRMWT
jgi:hypothetical protein